MWGMEIGQTKGKDRPFVEKDCRGTVQQQKSVGEKGVFSFGEVSNERGRTCDVRKYR